MNTCVSYNPNYDTILFEYDPFRMAEIILEFIINDQLRCSRTSVLTS